MKPLRHVREQRRPARQHNVAEQRRPDVNVARFQRLKRQFRQADQAVNVHVRGLRLIMQDSINVCKELDQQI